jgi:hypothetical protein
MALYSPASGCKLLVGNQLPKFRFVVTGFQGKFQGMISVNTNLLWFAEKTARLRARLGSQEEA